MLVQSAIALAAAALVFGASCLVGPGRRAAVAFVGLGGLLLAMLLLPYEPPNPMGDYSTFTEDRGHFDAYFGELISFQYHLSTVVLQTFDQFFGRTPESPARAFDALARAASVAFVVGLAAFGLSRRWTPHATRYVALVIALPTVILYFGYNEFGHLSMMATAVALPLALIGLEEKRHHLLVLAAGLLGIGAALHGFGVIALMFLFFLVAFAVFRAREGRLRDDVLLFARMGGAALVGWLIWVPFYVIVLNRGIIPGHADELPLRPLFRTTYSREYNRIDHALFSREVATELVFEIVITGAAILALLVWEKTRQTSSVLLASLPVIGFLLVFWPVQGLGNDSDFLAAAFPAFFAGAWLVARSTLTTAIAMALLLVGHFAIELILTDPRFIHGTE